MKKGICPNCGGRDIWMTKETGKESSYLLLGFLTSIDRETYCCLGCGLTQNFITQESLDNAIKMEKLRGKFTRV